MPSQRRVKLLMITVIAVLFLTFYYSGEASRIQNQKFYRTTLQAMQAKEEAKHMKTKEKIQDAMARPVGGQAENVNLERPAVPAAKDKQTEELQEVPIAGRTKMTIPKNKADQQVASSDSDSSDAQKEGETTEQNAKAEQDAKAELNTILKRSPIIIFSKSYCPYSKKAKSILLEAYTISPKPFVVELDQHPLGPDLQNLLAQNTGRRTVPNVLVNGKSIGGGDDIAALDQSDDLASTLRTLGGKWVADVTHAPPKNQL